MLDTLDDFPLNPDESIDTDNDGIGNNADLDDDNDGVLDALDDFPLNPDESIAESSSGGGGISLLTMAIFSSLGFSRRRL